MSSMESIRREIRGAFEQVLNDQADFLRVMREGLEEIAKSPNRPAIEHITRIMKQREDILRSGVLKVNEIWGC